MNRPKVVVAENIAPVAIELMQETLDVDLAVGVSRPELLRRVADAAALIVRSATRVDAELIGAAAKLQVIGRAGIGVDNIDVHAATRAGVMVINAPDANTVSAAEHTMAMLLAQARRIPEADAALRRGSWERKRFQGVELHGKTLGILGLGRIGTLVAQRAAAFGMDLVIYDPFINEERAKRLGAEIVSLDELLRRSDFVTLHLPRTPETTAMLDADAFGKMKSSARVVNVARGGIVDEEALAAAVRNGVIAGAALDVFAVEPKTESPLFDLPQVVVTPHLGASTREAQDKAGVSVAEDVVQALQGRMVASVLNVDIGGVISDDARQVVHLAEKLGRIFAMFSFGLPDELTVTVRGAELEESLPVIALGATKGAMEAASDEPVSYVNAPVLAEHRGLVVNRHLEPEDSDYRTSVRVSGVVADRQRTVAGTVMAHKGPVLIDVDGYEIEFTITPHMILIRNTDMPGVIGAVGTYLGNAEVNIGDMAVGRFEGKSAIGAMMGLSVNRAITDEELSQMGKIEGVLAVRYLAV